MWFLLEIVFSGPVFLHCTAGQRSTPLPFPFLPFPKPYLEALPRGRPCLKIGLGEGEKGEGEGDSIV